MPKNVNSDSELYESQSESSSSDDEESSIDENASNHSNTDTDGENEAQTAHDSLRKNHSYERTPPASTANFKKQRAIIPKSKEGGKWYYKSNACPYCDKILARVDRHLINMHGDKKPYKK